MSLVGTALAFWALTKKEKKMRAQPNCPTRTYNTECAGDWDWPLRVELTDVFASIRLLNTADVEEPGVSGEKQMQRDENSECWMTDHYLLSNVEENLSFWATISGNTAIIPFSEWSHATCNQFFNYCIIKYGIIPLILKLRILVYNSFMDISTFHE